MRPQLEMMPDWQTFRRRLEGYSELPARRRRQIIFRGQGNGAWPLETTLDRFLRFSTKATRSTVLDVLIREFRQQAAGILSADMRPQTPRGWELLARHQGLPTPILDWTHSPFVASFFAFSSVAEGAETVAVWVLDRDRLSQRDIPELEFVGDVDDTWNNVRAVEQRSVFMRAGAGLGPLEEALRGLLGGFALPASEATIALGDLDEMLINQRQLFRSLESAAITAARRAREELSDAN